MINYIEFLILLLVREHQAALWDTLRALFRLQGSLHHMFYVEYRGGSGHSSSIREHICLHARVSALSQSCSLISHRATSSRVKGPAPNVRRNEAVDGRWRT